jgi:tRNA pseudouridine55 synthase
MPSLFHGFLVLDKHAGITSRDAVDDALAWFPRGTRIGHTGTLDPLATGVLVLAVGAATRLTEYVQRMTKTYRAGLCLGASSDTDDADGRILPIVNAAVPALPSVADAVRAMVGEIDQVPPAFSAARTGGRRAYELARKGNEVGLKPRRVNIYGIDILRFDYPHLELEVRCGKGTYIRSLARDLGTRLHSGAYVESLRRLKVGAFLAAQALPLDTDAATVHTHLLPIAAAVSELPQIALAANEIFRLRRGQSIPLSGSPNLSHRSPRHLEVAVLGESGALIAVAALDTDRQLLSPLKVFAE